MKKFFRWFRLESYKIIHQFIRITWKCGWSVAVCIVLILALWFMDQGSDILIGLVGNTDGFLKGHLYVGLGYAFATLLAFFIWYMPKLIITDDSNKSGDVGIGQVSTFKKLKIRVKDNLQRSKNIPTPDKNKVHWMFSFLEDYQFPRLLGISVFFIIGIACLNIHYQSFAKSDSLLKIVFENRVSILFLLIIVFGFFLSWLERKYKTREKLSLKLKYLPADILMLIVLGVIVYLAYYLSLQNRLMMLGIGMMLMAFPFSAFVVLRRKITSFPRLHRLKLYHLVLILALLLLLTFVYFNLGFYSPGLLFEYPFGVLFGLLSLLVFSLTFFTYLTRKWNFTFQAFIIIFLLSMYMPSARHYEVRKVEQNSALSKVDLDSYFTKWLSDRNLLGDADSSMSTTDSFHVFLVAAEGGGSTLGLWSSLVLSELNMNPKFYEHCFMMTGASGGMAGATHFVSLKNHLFEDTTRLPAEKFPEIFSKTFTNDFLSGSLCYMFGRDVLNAIIPLGGIDDRAALLEKEWSLELYKNLYDQKGAKLSPEDIVRSPLDRDYLDLYYKKDSLFTGNPLMVFAPVSVRSGNQGFIHPFNSFSDSLSFPFSIDILNSIKKNNTEDNEMSNPSIRLSTAALLQGRFPYINPIGNVEACGESFVDAGYYDNNGGIKVLEFLNKLVEISDSLPLKKTLLFYVISIQKADKKLKDASVKQGIGVLQATINSRWGSSNQNLALVKQSNLVKDYFEFELPTEDFDKDLSSDEIYQVIPLARYLSPNASQLIKDQLKEKRNVDSFKKFKSLNLE